MDKNAPAGNAPRPTRPRAPKEDGRLVYRDEKKFRMPVALIIVVIWAIMVAVVMNLRSFMKTGDNRPVSEVTQSEAPK